MAREPKITADLPVQGPRMPISSREAEHAPPPPRSGASTMGPLCLSLVTAKRKLSYGGVLTGAGDDQSSYDPIQPSHIPPTASCSPPGNLGNATNYSRCR